MNGALIICPGKFSILPVLLAVSKSSSLEQMTSMRSSSVILSAFCFLFKGIKFIFSPSCGWWTVDEPQLVCGHACFFLSNGFSVNFCVGGSEHRPERFAAYNWFKRNELLGGGPIVLARRDEASERDPGAPPPYWSEGMRG